MAAIEKGDTVYRYGGNYYLKSEDFRGTYAQFSPGSSSRSLISRKAVNVVDLTDEEFRPEPNSKSKIKEYYQEEANRKVADLSAKAQAGEITWEEAEAGVRAAEERAETRNEGFWAKRAEEKAAQEARNRERELAEMPKVADTQKYYFKTDDGRTHAITAASEEEAERRMDSIAARDGTRVTESLGARGFQGGAGYDSIIAQDPILADMLSSPEKRAEFDALPPELQGTFLEMSRAASRAIEAGRVINPDLVKITPAQLKQFYDQAEDELDPYYKEKFSLLKGDIDRSISRLVKDYTTEVGRSEAGFKEDLQAQAQDASESGTVYSSGRQQQEQRRVLTQNQALEDTTKSLTRNVQDLGFSYEEQAGSDRARTLSIPTIPTFTATARGTYTPQDRRTLFFPSGKAGMGTIGKDRETALRARQNELEKSFRTSRVLDTSSLS